MICPTCQSQQEEHHTFCTQCGAALRRAEPDKPAGQAANQAGGERGGGFLPFIAAGALLAAVMFASAKLLAQITASVVKQDLYFFAAEELLGLSAERAVLFYRGLEDAFWHLFNQFSGGYYKGLYIMGEETAASFEFHFPVFVLLLYLLFWVSFSFFLLNKLDRKSVV